MGPNSIVSNVQAMPLVTVRDIGYMQEKEKQRNTVWVYVYFSVEDPYLQVGHSS